VIERNLQRLVVEAASYYPIVTITGPRQSGKTTLCRAAFPDKPYVSLEPLDARAYALGDPRGFLHEYADGAILDEIQNTPELLSYIQADVDARPDLGRYILTGSQHLGLSEAVAQSLAGRTAVLHLLPPTLDELARFELPARNLFETLWAGAYPRIYDRQIPPDRFLSDYVTSYVQRDVRQVINVGDLQGFDTFLRLCGGRTAQEIHLSNLGADAGISHNTARAWLSVLEATFVAFRLPSWFRNVRKQIVKAPKLHFFDTGLLCSLLGISTPEQLRHHPLRGAIFESWVASEIYKARTHAGKRPDLYHYRDAKRLEVDMVLERGDALVLVEAKSGSTVGQDYFGSLSRLAASIEAKEDAPLVEQILVYGGDSGQQRSGVEVRTWHEIAEGRWGAA